MQILTDKLLFLVGTVDGFLSVFMFVRKEAKLKISLIGRLDVN